MKLHGVVACAALLANPGAHAIAASGGADPAIAFARGTYGNFELLVMNDDGTRQTVLLTGMDGTGDWSPDLDGDASNGYQGTLAAQRDVAGCWSGIVLLDVRVVGGVPTGVHLRDLAACALKPSWSPDLDPVAAGYQGKIAYADDGVWTVDVAWDVSATDPSTYHSTSPVFIADAGDIGWSPTFSQDGLRLVYSARELLPDGTEGSSIFLVDDLANPAPRRILGPDPIVAGYLVVDPAWSHKSSWIAFTNLAWSVSAPDQVWCLDVDNPGSSLVQLPISGRSPSWSPDDGRLAFAGVPSRSRYSRIYVYDFQSRATVELASDRKRSLSAPAWRRG